MNVLIVDDDKDCLNDIADALEPLDYNCIKELSPLKALDIFEEKKIDVVISDIRMPEMNGIELLKKIKNIDEKAKVIIITGFGDLDTAVSAINNKAYAFFGKPIDFKELVGTLRKIEDDIKNESKIEIDYENLGKEYRVLRKAYDELLDVVKKMKGETEK